MIARETAPVGQQTISPAAAEGRTRALDIDRAKGFAIALVVFGHTSGNYGNATPLWFPFSVETIYGFHMPFFMYLSGFVFFMVGAQYRLWRRPASYIWSRFDRLMIPVIVFGVVVVLGKDLASSFGPIDDDVTSISDGLLRLVTNAPGNPCIAVWYLIALFAYSLIAPVLYRLGRNTIALVLLAGCLGWTVAVTELFYLHRLAIYFVFFGVGGLIATHRTRILPIMKRTFLPALVLLGIASYFLFGTAAALLVCGLLSIVAFHGLFLRDIWSSDRLFLTLGRYSMAIYLLNTIAIGLGKLLYLPRLPYEGAWFPVMIATFCLLGIAGPIVIVKAMNTVPLLRPVTRYFQ